MGTMLTAKGQVTIPKHVRDALDLTPGTEVDFTVNAAGELVLRRAVPREDAKPDRFDRALGRATIPWRTDELMTLLRG